MARTNPADWRLVYRIRVRTEVGAVRRFQRYNARLRADRRCPCHDAPCNPGSPPSATPHRASRCADTGAAHPRRRRRRPRVRSTSRSAIPAAQLARSAARAGRRSRRRRRPPARAGLELADAHRRARACRAAHAAAERAQRHRGRVGQGRRRQVDDRGEPRAGAGRRRRARRRARRRHLRPQHPDACSASPAGPTVPTARRSSRCARTAWRRCRSACWSSRTRR